MSDNATAILDFDDLTDGNDPHDALMRLKERDGGFKVTLFAIPTRCGDTLLKKYEAIKDWCALGIHGWRHSRHECLAWTSEEAVDKVIRAKSIYQHFAPIFKAPNWETCDELYMGLQNAGVAVADHVRNIEVIPEGMPVYIYNLRTRQDKFNRLHGHIQPWAGTGLTENANGNGVNPTYLLPIGTRYAFATDGVVPHQRGA